MIKELFEKYGLSTECLHHIDDYGETYETPFKHTDDFIKDINSEVSGIEAFLSKELEDETIVIRKINPELQNYSLAQKSLIFEIEKRIEDHEDIASCIEENYHVYHEYPEEEYIEVKSENDELMKACRDQLKELLKAK